MGSKDYRKWILERLLKKYHNRIAKKINTDRRIILKPEEIYRNYTENNADISEKQKVNEAVHELRDMGMVTVQYLKFSTDIEKIYLCENSVDAACRYLQDEYGIIPQSAISEEAELLIEQYRFRGELVQNYCDSILSRIADPRVSIDLERITANLKMLDFLEKNQEDLYVREVSVLVYGDSKWFEKNNYDEICNIIRETLHISKEESE